MKQENSVTLTGYLGKDAELISTSKASICKLSLCQSRAKKNAEGGWDKLPPNWFKLTGFHDEARNMATMKKGSFIKFVGRVEPDIWEKGGVKHYDMRFIAQHCEVLEPPKDRLGNPEYPAATSNTQDEELPF